MAWSATKFTPRCCLVVRREGDGIRRYVHLATGNYNPTTARLYTDLGLLTCRRSSARTRPTFFNLLTGICQFQGLRKLLVAPFELHRPPARSSIEREAANARAGPAGAHHRQAQFAGGPADHRGALPRLAGGGED